MQLRQLGSTGLWISPMGLGTIKFGRNQQVRYPQPFEIPDDQAIRNLLCLAHDLGINFLDTAPAYGLSEEHLGKLLKPDRKDWIIMTKTGEEFANGESTYNFSRQHTRMSIERSLRRLGTDYLDVVLVHSNGDDIDIIQQTDIIETLAELKKAGLIRSYGMSTKTVAGGKLAVDLTDAVMATYNTGYQDEKAVLEYAHQHKKGLLIKKALSSGHLSNPLTVDDQFEFIFNQPGISSIITGTINQTHLKQNAQAINNSCAL